MGKIIIPEDRTTKQPVRACCFNPECREKSEDERFEFDVQHEVECPKCGCDATLLVLIHFLVSDRKGPIRGSEGRRYRFACDPLRVIMATATNHEACSGDLRAVNCPGCLQAAIDNKLARVQGTIAKPSA